MSISVFNICFSCITFFSPKLMTDDCLLFLRMASYAFLSRMFAKQSYDSHRYHFRESSFKKHRKCRVALVALLTPKGRCKREEMCLNLYYLILFWCMVVKKKILILVMEFLTRGATSIRILSCKIFYENTIHRVRSLF